MVIKDIVDAIQQFFAHEKDRHNRGLLNVLGILLEGHPGVGKLHLASSLCRSSGLSWKFIKVADFFQCSAEDVSKSLVGSFLDSEARILVVEDLDLLAAKPRKEEADYDRSLRAALAHVFEQLGRRDCGTVVIGTTSSVAGIDEAWLCGTRFAQVHRITISKPEQRLAILKHSLGSLLSTEQMAELASRTHGFTAADLELLKSEAFSRSTLRSSSELPGLGDFIGGLAAVRPSLMAQFYQPLPKQSLEELVGVDSIIARLRDLLITPIQEPALCKTYNLTLPRGILIHGGTGAGKTHLALGLVKEAGLNYIHIHGTSIRSKYVGQSEKNLAAAFQGARDCAPSILLIDHIDGLVTTRGSSNTSDNSADRLITCFLTEMDGLMTKGADDGVVVIGITDSIHQLDPAMLRPGRLGIHIEMPSELAPNDRRKFFSASMIPIELSEEELVDVVARTEGHTGADLDSLCRRSAMHALAEGTVRYSHFCRALSRDIGAHR